MRAKDYDWEGCGLSSIVVCTGSLAIANKLHSLIIRPKRRGSFGNHGSFVQQSTSSLSFKGGSEHMEENVASTHSQPLMGASQHM